MVAIAYDWVLAPIDFNDFDLVVNIGQFDSTIDKVNVTTYRARLPGRKNSRTQSDVSGNLGLVFPVSDDSAGKRAGVSERLIADALIWELSKIAFPDIETAILIQGPMLPKLRGRLLYRGVPKHIKIWGVTWQPEWFWRLEASQQLLENIEILQSKGIPLISPMYPPQGIDRASRSWVCKRAEKAVYHFELLTNTWDAISTSDWSSVGELDIPRFVGPSELGKNPPYLPEAMRLASDTVREKSDLERYFLWFLPQLREDDHNPHQCAKRDKRLQSAIEFIDPAFAGADLFAGTSEFDWSNEDAVYAAFNNNPQKLLTLFREQVSSG